MRNWTLALGASLDIDDIVIRPVTEKNSSSLDSVVKKEIHHQIHAWEKNTIQIIPGELLNLEQWKNAWELWGKLYTSNENHAWKNLCESNSESTADGNEKDFSIFTEHF